MNKFRIRKNQREKKNNQNQISPLDLYRNKTEYLSKRVMLKN